MSTYVVNFKTQEVELIETNPHTAYSRVWEELNRNYGDPIFADSHGSCFRGKNGETAVLTDHSTDSGLHELVLVDVPVKVLEELQQITSKDDTRSG